MKLLIFIMLISPLFVFARGGIDVENDNVKDKIVYRGETVELALGLEVFRECNGELCMGISPIHRVQKIYLKADLDGCHGPGCVPWSYVGRVSSVESLSGVRYISIITVRKNIMARDGKNKPIDQSYSIKIEIIGDEGLEAKAQFNDIKDISKLDAVNLSTIAKEVYGQKFYATVFVGDKNDGFDPSPCDDIDSCNPMPISIEPSSIENLILTKGLLLK